MTTKRKPEDVVLDESLRAAAWGTYCDYESINYDSFGVALRTYIAEADLIPRPQTAKEWAEQMPESVWEHSSMDGTEDFICVYGTYNEATNTPSQEFRIATIPRPKRPKPPRMTDEEIERLATETAKNTALGDSKATVEDRAFAIEIYRQTRDELLAERAKLEKESKE